MYTERGNVALSNGSSAVLWILDNNKNAVKEISYTPDNYPAWYVDDEFFLNEKDLAAHINDKLQGWFVHKANINGINIDENGTVTEEES